MTEKSKILVVPSWYPSPEFPARGTFFREQALLMSNSFDMRVLVAEPQKNWKGLFSSANRRIAQRKDESTVVYSFKVYDIPFLPSKVRFKLKLWQYANALKQIIEQENWKPDMLHAHSTFFAGIFAFSLWKKFAIPFTTTEHSPLDMDIHIVSKQVKYYALEALQKATPLMAVSYSRRREIIWHLPLINPGVIGNLVSEDHFQYVPKPAANPFRVLIIAHASLIKDLNTFFKVAAILSERFKEKVAFDVIGFNGWGGNNDKQIQTLAAKYGVLENCHLRGTVSRDEIVGYYHRAHAFVLTSIAEGMPVSVLEALATGTPVFSTRCGGAEEVVTDFCGRICEIKDAEAMANHLSDLIENKTAFDGARMSEYIFGLYGKTAFHNAVKKQYNMGLKKINAL
jgi:glycosyltransferase involved in cell wall biosynthesis